MTIHQQKGVWEAPAAPCGSGVDKMGVPGSTGGDSFRFYVGLHQPGDAKHFGRCCISINRLKTRKKPVECDDVMVDSGAFTVLDTHGFYPDDVSVYAAQLYRLWNGGVVKITIAAAQDFMCEPFMLAKTGLSVAEHQRLTIERYDALLAELTRLFDGPPPFQLMPVLQGYRPAEYLDHLAAYGDRLTPGMWVGVGSVCKRQGNVSAIEDLLWSIKEVRPDLRLHGFWREAHGPAKPSGSGIPLQRRQHGLVLRRTEGGAKRERLARGRGFQPARRRRPHHTLSTSPSLRIA